MENLPGDLIIKILINLPLISIGRCRCVCKSWYKLVDQKFVSMKRNHDIEHENFRVLVATKTIVDSKIIYHVESKSLISDDDVVNIMYPFVEIPHDAEGVKIVGSCDGLVCASHAGYIFYVWNPCTGEYKVIRSPFGFRNRFFEFGYDSRTCDYKFVSIYCRRPDMNVSQVEIYTLGSNSWENYHSYNPYEFMGKHGVFLDGAIHWLAKLRTSKKRQPRLLISMDLEDGVFKEVPQPEQMDVGFDHIFVEVLRGFLCLVCSVSNNKFEIWEMKEYGVKESWCKVFKTDMQEHMPIVGMGIGSRQYVRRVLSLKDGEILLEIIEKDEYREKIDILKIHSDETERHQNRTAYNCVSDNNCRIFLKGSQNRGGYGYMKIIRQMESYVESLVSVNSGTFVWNEHKDYYKVEEPLVLLEFPLSLTQE